MALTPLVHGETDIYHPSYQFVEDIGVGHFGVAKLMIYRPTGEKVAVKFIERGDQIDENVERELVNHRTLIHPNIVKFREVFITTTHLAIAMEYAGGGELFNRVASPPRYHLLESEARVFFRELLAGVEYCHNIGVCHRDLKLENILLDNSSPPHIKICDFGYSKSAVLHSTPKSEVGSAKYVAPEVLSHRQYDGLLADVWSSGVTLYIMVVGAYPFEDPEYPNSDIRTFQRICAAKYRIPSRARLSEECVDLLRRIFVVNPSQRITLRGIKQHPWFLHRDLPDHVQACFEHPTLPTIRQHMDDRDRTAGNGAAQQPFSAPAQTEVQIRQILQEARQSAYSTRQIYQQ